MPLFNTTDIVDSSIFLKAKLDKNKVGSNYYIENLQNKRDKDWEYRSNIVGIEEELNKQVDYTGELPLYTPIDVAIRGVKGEKGKDLGDDWADIAFRDLKHPLNLGGRYRFSLDFPDMSLMSEEDKYYDTSVWITINKQKVSPGNSCVIRRCNTSLAMVGSPTNSYADIQEIHYEPVILDNDLKYINYYFNQTLVQPQAEWYATMQMNYFTNNIKINDRFIFGGVDLNDRENNAVYKVKAVVKSASTKTFSKSGCSEIENIPFVILALDKDMVDPKDDFETRVADQCPIYLTKERKPAYQYYIDLVKPYEERILLGDTEYYTCELYWNGNKKDTVFSITAELKGVEYEDGYYILNLIGDNRFSIKNLKTCNIGILVVTCSCINPAYEENANGNAEGDIDIPVMISNSFEFQLGGFY